MNTLFVFKNRGFHWLLGVLTFVASMAAFIAPTRSSAAEPVEHIRSMEVAKFTDKHGNNVTVQYELSAKSQMASTSPAALRQDGARMRAEIKQMCAARAPGVGGTALARNPMFRFAKTFGVEASSFAMAVGLSGGIMSGQDPAYARHFVEHSITDPMAHVSFAGFMIANHGAANLFTMMNWTHDPCVIIKKNPYATSAMLTESKFQSKFKFIAGPLAMSAGLIMSSELHEVLADPNIQKCAALQIGKIKDDAAKQQAEKACDDAYADWVTNGGSKIRKLVPDMLSMGLVTGILGLANKYKGIATAAAGAEEKAVAVSAAQRLAGTYVEETAMRVTVIQGSRTVILRGLMVAMNVGRMVPTPASRIAVAIGSTWVFLKLNDWVLPAIQGPWESLWQGKDIGGSLAAIDADMNRLQANGWTYTAAPKVSTAALVERLGKQQRAWRDHLLTETNQAVSNWQDYVLRFVNVYTDAQKFYGYILNQILYKEAGNSAPIFETPKLAGVPFVSSEWTTGKICDIPKDTKQIFNEAIAAIDAAIVQEKRPSIVLFNYDSKTGLSLAKDRRFAIGGPDHYDIAQLNTIRDGLAAMNCEIAMPGKPAGATEQQIEALRIQKYNSAVAAIFWELAGRTNMGVHQSSSRDLESPDYAASLESNVFMKVNYILGGVGPFPEGVSSIKSISHDAELINQDHATEKPLKLQGVDTFMMSEYLLTSMVCGPAANESVKRRAMWDVQFQPPRIVNPLGVNPCAERAASKPVMMSSTVGHVLGAEIPTMDPHMSEWTINGKKYDGMLAIIKAFVNRSITGRDYANSNFGNWWLQNLESQAKPLFATFRNQFVTEVLMRKYLPALTSTGYTTQVRLINKKGLALGLANAITDSADENLKILAQIVIEPTTSVAEAKAFGTLEGRLIRRLRVGLNLVGSSNSARAAAASLAREFGNLGAGPVNSVLDASAFTLFQANQTKTNEVLATLRGFIANKINARPLNAKRTLIPIAEAVLKNLKDLVTEIENYHGIVVSVRMDTAG